MTVTQWRPCLKYKWRYSLVAIAAASAWTLGVPACQAASFTWTGEGAETTWSTAANWQGGAAPSGSVGTLYFPTYLRCEEHPCSTGDNDIPGIEAHQLHFAGYSLTECGATGDTSATYYGDPLTIGSGGIIASCNSYTSVNMPLILSAPQTWLLENSSGYDNAALWLEGGTVTGSGSLSIQMGEKAFLDLVDEVEVGPVTIESGLVSASIIDATDGNAVTLIKGALRALKTGPVVSQGGAVSVTYGAMEVAGSVILDSASRIELGVAAAAGQVAAINATGTVSLNGATLELNTDFSPGECGFTAGQRFPLVKTTASLEGTFVNAADGDIIGSACPEQRFRIEYGSHEVTAIVVALPVNTLAPAYSNPPRVGEAAVCSPGTWTGDTPQSYSYTWYSDGIAVKGPSADPTYVPMLSDLGHALQCEVTATNDAGSSAATSSAKIVLGVVVVVPPANTTAPVVDGSVPEYFCPSAWSGSPTGFSYTWLRNGVPVAGPSSKLYDYTATGADAGQQLACEVTASNAAGSASATSAAVAVPGYWPPRVVLEALRRNEVRYPCSRSMDSACDNASVGLAGEIIPGSMPIKHWHFVYYSATHPRGTVATKEETGYTPGRLERCVGLCNGEALKPYYRYDYYLEAYDGHQWTKSAAVPFVGGGLANPPNWNPLGEHYVLTLFCKTGCAAIQQHANTPIAHVQEPLTGEEEAGELEITAFNRATGEVTGIVEFTAIGDRMVVQGAIGEGLASLELFSLVDPASALGTHFANFSLPGGVDYGGFQPRSGYAPSFEGLIDAGQKWTMCVKGTGCTNKPSLETKAIADALSSGSGFFGVASALVPGLDTIDFGLTVFGAVTDAIRHDPPDPGYTKIARPSHMLAPAVRPTKSLDADAARAATKVVRLTWQSASYGEAFLNSVQRAQGALKAKRMRWVGRQRAAAATYGLKLASQCRNLAELLQSDRQLLEESPISRAPVTTARVRDAISALHHRGLPATTLRTLRQLGFTPASMKKAQQLASHQRTRLQNPLHAMLTPAFISNLVVFAEEIEQFADLLANQAP